MNSTAVRLLQIRDQGVADYAAGVSPFTNPYTATDPEDLMGRVEATMWRVGWRRNADLPEVLVEGDTWRDPYEDEDNG